MIRRSCNDSVAQADLGDMIRYVCRYSVALYSLALCLAACAGCTGQSTQSSAPSSPNATAAPPTQSTSLADDSTSTQDALSTAAPLDPVDETEETWTEDEDLSEPPPKEAIDKGGFIPRKNVYRLKRDGMIIQIDGAEFVPSVSAIRTKKGWGLKLTIVATSREEQFLSSPEKGPLSFGGSVTRRGKAVPITDRRSGDSLLSLIPRENTQFERSWPETGEKALSTGDELELQVGLWGLGPSQEDLPPVRRFLVIKMTAGKKGALPMIEPPRF